MITSYKDTNNKDLRPWKSHGLISFNLKSMNRIEHEFLDFAADFKNKKILSNDLDIENH